MVLQNVLLWWYLSSIFNFCLRQCVMRKTQDHGITVALPFTSCVVLSKLLKLSDSSCSSLKWSTVGPKWQEKYYRKSSKQVPCIIKFNKLWLLLLKHNFWAHLCLYFFKKKKSKTSFSNSLQMLVPILNSLLGFITGNTIIEYDVSWADRIFKQFLTSIPIYSLLWQLSWVT